jgi:hypothetical protein
LVECDVVVFTGDWIPDNELARGAGLELDDATRGPLIDTSQATSASGVFAIGNLVHPADAADVAALDGRAVVEPLLRHLVTGATQTSDGGNGPEARQPGPRLLPGENLAWITPGLLRHDFGAPGGRLSCRPRHEVPFPTVTLSQYGEVRARRRLPWPASPGRVYRIPASVLAGIDIRGPDVTIGLVGRER